MCVLPGLTFLEIPRPLATIVSESSDFLVPPADASTQTGMLRVEFFSFLNELSFVCWLKNQNMSHLPLA